MQLLDWNYKTDLVDNFTIVSDIDIFCCLNLKKSNEPDEKSHLERISEWIFPMVFFIDSLNNKTRIDDENSDRIKISNLKVNELKSGDIGLE